MKFASLISALVFSCGLSAQASFIGPGAFIPTLCGSQNDRDVMSIIDIDRVCIGEVRNHSSEELKGIEFQLSSGQKELYVITEVQERGPSRTIPEMMESKATLQNQDGNELVVTLYRNHYNGQIMKIMGEYEVISFRIDHLEEVYNVQ